MFLHYLGKDEPRKLSFQSCCTPCLENYIALACCIFDTYQPIVIFFGDNKVVFLSTVCKYYFLPSHFIFDKRCTAWLKRHNLRGSCFSIVQRHYETWDNKSSFVSILSQQSLPKIIKIGWSASKLQCATSVSFFETQCRSWVMVPSEWSCCDFCCYVDGFNCFCSHVCVCRNLKWIFLVIICTVFLLAVTTSRSALSTSDV